MKTLQMICIKKRIVTVMMFFTPARKERDVNSEQTVIIMLDVKLKAKPFTTEKLTVATSQNKLLPTTELQRGASVTAALTVQELVIII